MSTGQDFDAFESLAVAGTAATFTSGTYGDARTAFVTCETAAVRFRVDGTAPTATVGHELLVGDTLELNSRDQVVDFQAIRRGGTSATLSCSFGGQP